MIIISIVLVILKIHLSAPACTQYDFQLSKSPLADSFSTFSDVEHNIFFYMMKSVGNNNPTDIECLWTIYYHNVNVEALLQVNFWQSEKIVNSLSASISFIGKGDISDLLKIKSRQVHQSGKK